MDSDPIVEKNGENIRIVSGENMLRVLLETQGYVAVRLNGSDKKITIKKSGGKLIKVTNIKELE